jgi:hypothetical protein
LRRSWGERLPPSQAHAIEEGVKSIGAPASAVGVVIALLVLMPETLTAWRNAARGRLQISFNLAYGSAMASIGFDDPGDRDRLDLASSARSPSASAPPRSGSCSSPPWSAH